MQDIKSYKPENNSLCSGQVLQSPYDFEKAKLIVREMTDLLVLDLVEKQLVTDQIVLTVGYDVENLINPETSRLYSGPVTTDMYGRKVPKHAHGTTNLGRHTSSTKLIIEAISELYDRIVDKNLLIRRVTVTANHLLDEKKAMEKNPFVQLDLFTDYSSLQKKLEREKQMQRAILGIKKKYGKNAILKGMNLIEGATTKERNDQIGGHRA